MSHRLKNLKNQGGSAILEGLIGAAMAIIIIFVSISSVNQINKLAMKVSVGDTSNKQVAEIAESIRTNLKSYQVDYNFYSAINIEAALNPDTLPMAWDTKTNSLVLDCTNCRGRYGFIIQPYEKFRGLYMVTLRVKHEDWGPGFRTHQFVVSAK